MRYICSVLGTHRRLILYWAPLLAWMAAIFALSSLTPSEIEGTLPRIEPAVAHVVEFGVLGGLAYRLLWAYGVTATSYLWGGALFLAIVYGATDELHQAFVPGRDPSWTDLGFDSLGAVIGLLVWEALPWRRYGRGRRKAPND